MKPLKIGDSLTLEVGDFIVISCGNHLDYGWYCGQGNFGSTLQYYSVRTPGHALENFERWEAGEEMPEWIVQKFERSKGFTSKCFYKRFLNSYYESRILKPANPDDLFTDPEDIEAYNKSKQALIKIKFLNK
jgi:hypothetical protein